MKTNSPFNSISILTVLLIFIVSDSYSTTWNINVSNFVFTPSSVSVSVGDTVKWNWISGNHTTTCDGSAFTSRPPGAASWNSTINSGIPSFKYVVTVAGTYNYKCTFHAPGMVGIISATSPAINLNLTSILEGFWNGSVMVSDTVKVYFRNSTTPFAKIDSASVKLNTSGNGLLAFTHASSGSYYIVVTHRNALETWSKVPVAFTTGATTNYDFTTAANKSYGDNLILKDGKFCVFSGDVNHDGFVNLDDVIIIYNASAVFLSGYVVTDVNGDNITDLSDILIAFNNSGNFVSVKKPA